MIIFIEALIPTICSVTCIYAFGSNKPNYPILFIKVWSINADSKIYIRELRSYLPWYAKSF